MSAKKICEVLKRIAQNSMKLKRRSLLFFSLIELFYTDSLDVVPVLLFLSLNVLNNLLIKLTYFLDSRLKRAFVHVNTILAFFDTFIPDIFVPVSY